VVPVALGEAPGALDLLVRDLVHAVLARVELDHQEEREVIEDGRDARHLDHFEVRDLEELRDEERGGAENRRREDRAEAAGGEKTAGGARLVARALQHRVRHRADGDRGGDTRPRGPAQQEGGEHHRTPRARGLAAEEREGEVEEELARAGVLQESAVNGEEDDERGRDVDRDAEDAFERHVHVADEARDVVAAMRPRRRQPRADEGVEQEDADHDGHDPAGAAARRLDHERDQHDPEDHVPGRRVHVAVGEGVALPHHVDDGGHRDQRERRIPPLQPVAKALRRREQHVAEEEDDADVHFAQQVGADDAVGGVEVEGGARDRDRREEEREPAAIAVEAAFLFLDEFLEPRALRFGQLGGARLVLGHGPLLAPLSRG
jgi:hypothetical protein